MSEPIIVKSWDALPPVLYDGDIAYSTRTLEHQHRSLERRLEAMERARPLCPDCRDKCKDERCLRCQIQKLERQLKTAVMMLTNEQRQLVAKEASE